MSRDKQIEEMALEMASEARTCIHKVECKNCGMYLTDSCRLVKYAKRFAEKGYRKEIEGEWMPKPVRTREPFARNYYCSVCKHDPIELNDFCPNCGAKMKGE